jgi:hypothetical protein
MGLDLCVHLEGAVPDAVDLSSMSPHQGIGYDLPMATISNSMAIPWHSGGQLDHQQGMNATSGMTGVVSSRFCLQVVTDAI